MAEEQTATDNTQADSQQTTDNAATSDQPAEQTAAETPQAIPGAPESYEPFKLPEDVTVNEEVLGKFSQLAKDANLPQDKAQSLVELGAEMAKGFESAAQKSLEELKTSFSTQLANDTEIGGESLDANLAVAQRAIDTFGSKELKDMLDGSGLNKHPELVRFFYKVGQTVAEDTQGDGSPSRTGQKSLAERMYGSDEAAA